MAGASTRWGLAAVLMLSLGGMRAEDAGAAEPPAGAIPFPVNKTQTVRGKGSVYYLDGAVVIPEKVQIRVEMGVTLLGINNASLEVKGGLQIHGTVDNWVQVKNIDFSPTHHPDRGMHLDMVSFRKCTFAHTAEKPYIGVVTIENAAFQRGCRFEWRMHQGKLKIMDVLFGTPCVIRCEPPVGKKSDIMVEVRASQLQTLRIHGHGNATVRHCEVQKAVEFHNVKVVVLDGCDIWDKVGVYQKADDTFKKVKFTKCNLWTGCAVEVKREPAAGQKKEKVFLQKFYFGSNDGTEPVLKPKELAELLVQGQGNVHLRLDKLRKSKHLLVPYLLWDTRPPPLR